MLSGATSFVPITVAGAELGNISGMAPRARIASIRVMPASGPSRIATATARLSSTTGEGLIWASAS